MTLRKAVSPAVIDNRRVRVGASFNLLPSFQPVFRSVFRPAAVADRGRIRMGASFKLLPTA